MSGHRHKLRVLFLLLCAAQLVVTSMGLAVAYQVLRSYSLDISYERSVNEARQTLTELTVFARSASPQNMGLDDAASLPNQLSQIDYASRLFLPKARALLGESADPSSPLVQS